MKQLEKLQLLFEQLTVVVHDTLEEQLEFWKSQHTVYLNRDYVMDTVLSLILRLFGHNYHLAPDRFFTVPFFWLFPTCPNSDAIQETLRKLIEAVYDTF